MFVAFDNIQVENRAVRGGQFLNGVDDHLFAQVAHYLRQQPFIFDVRNIHLVIVLFIFTVVIDGSIDHDGAKPSFKRKPGRVLIEIGQYFIKPIVQNFNCLFARAGIAQTNGQRKAIELLIEQILKLSITLSASIDQFLKGLVLVGYQFFIIPLLVLITQRTVKQLVLIVGIFFGELLL